MEVSELLKHRSLVTARFDDLDTAPHHWPALLGVALPAERHPSRTVLAFALAVFRRLGALATAHKPSMHGRFHDALDICVPALGCCRPKLRRRTAIHHELGVPGLPASRYIAPAALSRTTRPTKPYCLHGRCPLDAELPAALACWLESSIPGACLGGFSAGTHSATPSRPGAPRQRRDCGEMDAVAPWQDMLDRPPCGAARADPTTLDLVGFRLLRHSCS